MATARLWQRRRAAPEAVWSRCWLNVFVLTDENNEFLVELIVKNPSLYDSRLITYEVNVIQDNIWEHIGNKLNKTSNYL